MLRRWAALAVLVLATLSACSVPSRPAWWQPPVTEPTTAGAVPRWQTGDRQLGVDVYWERTATDPDDYVRGKAQRVLDYLVSLGANSVSFSFPLFTDGVTSNNVYADARTPTPAQVNLVVAEAAARGLRITLRPILNEEVLVAEDHLAWRGAIQPTGRAQWFAHYSAAIQPYAAIENRDVLATFVVGTELDSLEGDPHWADVIGQLRSVFPGELRYSMNTDAFLHGDQDAPASADVDAYPPLALPDDASVDQLTAGWRAFLTQADSSMSTLVLSEVGIAAQSGAYRHPATWGSDDATLDLDIQRNWYVAVCRVVEELDLAGVYWWYLNFDTDPQAVQPVPRDRMSFVGRSAEQAIADCFTRLR